MKRFLQPLARLGSPWRWLRRRVTCKVMIGVSAGLLLVIAVYSHLVLKMREEMAQTRLISSQEKAFQDVRIAFYEASDEGNPHAAVERQLAQIARFSPMYKLRVLNTASEVAYSTHPPEVGQQFSALSSDPLGATAFRNVGSLPCTMTCRSCHDRAGPALGSLVVDYPQSALDQATGGDKWLLTTYAVMVLLMVGGVILIVTWAVVHAPLSALSQAIDRVRHGDLATPCRIETEDEYSRLADGFNGMVESLAAQRHEIEQMHQRQMAQADRLASVGKLASGLAHEIKNPLHGAAAALTIVRKRIDDAALGDVVGDIQGQLQRVVRLMEDMLQYARPGRPTFDRCELPTILERTLVLINHDADQRRVQIVREIDDDLPAVWADAEKLQQILLNLLLNAVQATEEASTVFVRLARAGDRVSIQVEDNGPGIGEAQRQRIFEPFYTTKPNGSGLGLPITRTLVEQHGGTLRIRDDNAYGACFEILLPVGQPTDRPPVPAETAP